MSQKHFWKHESLHWPNKTLAPNHAQTRFTERRNLSQERIMMYT